MIAWGISLIVYLLKKRKKRQSLAAGLPKPVVQPKEKIIIPPDPAVIQGQHAPGKLVPNENSENQAPTPTEKGDSLA